MVEGLTTSAPDPGSGAVDREKMLTTRRRCRRCEIVDLDFLIPAPVRSFERADAADHDPAAESW